MKFLKNKSGLKIAVFSGFFVVTSTAVAGISLASCSRKANLTYPSLTASSFSSLSSSIVPTVAGVLSSTTGRDSLLTSYVNKLLINWFKVVNNSSVEVTYKNWASSATKAYDNEYKNYKKKNTANWQQLFQQNVLDPVGGTKQDYIDNNIANNVKSAFIDNLFGSSAKEYLGYATTTTSGTTTITPVKDINLASLKDIDNTYVNATKVGEKNGFQFTGESILSNERNTIDYGYGDFMEYLMDSWIKNCLPLPLSMSLWKNGTSETKIKSLFSDYFTQDGTPTGFSEGSYNFQYFDPIDNDNQQKLTTTSKFKLLMNDLYLGSYVGSSTGLIKLNSSYTEDSSTTLVVPASKLFDGTYVTPFSAAAWYKFSSEVFGYIDSQVYTPASLYSTSIMKNFLDYETSASSLTADTTKNSFSFPYATKWTNPTTQTKGSVFEGEYKDAVGIRDILNLSSSTNIINGSSNASQSNNNSVLGNFILVRNKYGVHLIGIDRLSQMKKAITSTSNTINYFQKVLNELRNTFIYYYALDTIQGTTTYDVKNSLKTYLSDNFEQVILGYIEKLVDSPTSQVNNLFGAKVTSNVTSTINYSSDFGFTNTSNKDYTTYVSVLNELVKNGNNKFRELIDAANNYKYAVKANDFNQTLKKEIYNNQSTYNNNASASAWISNGIAGVLPFTRDSETGDFTYLQKLINEVVKSVSSSTTSSSVSKKRVYLDTKTTTPKLEANSTNNTSVDDTKTYLTKTKYSYQTALINYINANDLVVNPDNKTTGISTYIFTNNSYINKALLATGSDGTLNSIVYNSYMQKYVYPSGTNKVTSNLGNNSTTEGSNAWIASKLQDSIQNTYFMSNFVSISNIYSEGDWTDYNSLKILAKKYWESNWNATEFQYKISTSSNSDFGFNVYTKPSDAESFYKFLITLRYLLSWSSDTDSSGNQRGFQFSKLQEILDNATQVTSSNTGKAMVAWETVSSVTAEADYGIKSSTSLSNIQSKMVNNTTFKSLPMYLTNSNSYSWLGQSNPYDSKNSSNLSYTNSSNYWYVSPLGVSSSSKDTSTSGTGFLGFQLENNTDTGVDNKITTNAFTNSTYSNPISYSNSDNEEVKYRGMLYSYGTRSELVSYVKALSTPSLLTKFYEDNLKESGLPITESSKTAITDIINDNSIVGTDRVTKLQSSLVSIINDINQIPNSAFEKMTAMPLWNSNNNVQSTLFDTSDSTGALKTQYIISQFNNKDVQNLTSTISNTSYKKLTTGSNGYLGLDSTTFFNAVVMLANASSKIQTQALDAMLRDVGKIAIYDIRLLNVVDRSWVSNYDVWNKIKKLS